MFLFFVFLCELSHEGLDVGAPRTRVYGVSWVAFVEKGGSITVVMFSLKA